MKLTLQTRAFLVTFALLVASNCNAQGDGTLYNEKYRPQFHYTAEEGWLNDPNGLVYYDGEYHLFYQHTPSANRVLDDTRWGHAVSTDLVHWSQLQDALLPQIDDDGKKYPAFSGSAVVDHANSSGFQIGEAPPIVAIYTAWGLGQFLSYSNDRGRTWTTYQGNPVLELENDDKRNFRHSARDPKVFWHAESERWIMLLFQVVDGKQGFGIHRSRDLKQWVYESHIPGFYVCPDLFQLPIDGDRDNLQWVILDWEKYALADFNGQRIVRLSDVRNLDFGKNYSANQSWANLPSNDGRRIQIAWMRHAQYPDMPFNQQMTFPRELTLRKIGDKVLMYQWPIREIESLVESTKGFDTFTLKPGENPLASESAELLDIQLKVIPTRASTITLNLRGNDIVYDPSAGTVQCMNDRVQIHPPGEAADKFELRALLDRTSLEIFIGEGRWTMTLAFLPEEENISHSLNALGGEVVVESLVIRRMRSSWQDKPDRADP